MKKAKQENDTLLSVKDISKKLNINPSTVYSILRFEKLESVLISGRRLVRADKLEEWEKKNIKKSCQESNKSN